MKIRRKLRETSFQKKVIGAASLKNTAFNVVCVRSLRLYVHMFDPNAATILQHIHFLIKIAHQRKRAPCAYAIIVHTRSRLFISTLNM